MNIDSSVLYNIKHLENMYAIGMETLSRDKEQTKFIPSSIERLASSLRLIDGVHDGFSVLDLGCGCGIMSKVLETICPDAKYVGVDHTQANVDAVIAMGDDAVLGDLTKGIPEEAIAKGPFDYVTCIGVFSIGDLWDNDSAFKLLDSMWEIAQKGIIATFMRDDKTELGDDNVFDPRKVYDKLLGYTKQVTIHQPNAPHFVAGAAYKYESEWMTRWNGK